MDQDASTAMVLATLPEVVPCMHGCSIPKVAHGQNYIPRNKEAMRKVAPITVNEEPQKELEQKHNREKVEVLKQAMQEAELEESIAELVATTCMKVLKSKTDENGLLLHPTLSAKVKFEGTLWKP